MIIYTFYLDDGISACVSWVGNLQTAECAGTDYFPVQPVRYLRINKRLHNEWKFFRGRFLWIENCEHSPFKIFKRCDLQLPMYYIVLNLGLTKNNFTLQIYDKIGKRLFNSANKGAPVSYLKKRKKVKSNRQSKIRSSKRQHTQPGIIPLSLKYLMKHKVKILKAPCRPNNHIINKTAETSANSA